MEREGGLLPCFCIRCRSVTVPPSVASFFFFREQFVLARKMSRYPVSSASAPPSPPRRLSLSLSAALAPLLRPSSDQILYVSAAGVGKLDAASHGRVRITEEERKSDMSYQQLGPLGVVDAVS